ncbi:hypothetical protein VTN00DRAFT_6040 [Thermoascus crustaceus]|uniref:uncharacterized protein n=1 Tax=Thermoascus crustaceus TaxID=5088 RepID=UPI003743BAEF
MDCKPERAQYCTPYSVRRGRKPQALEVSGDFHVRVEPSRTSTSGGEFPGRSLCGRLMGPDASSIDAAAVRQAGLLLDYGVPPKPLHRPLHCSEARKLGIRMPKEPTNAQASPGRANSHWKSGDAATLVCTALALPPWIAQPRAAGGVPWNASRRTVVQASIHDGQDVTAGAQPLWFPIPLLPVMPSPLGLSLSETQAGSVIVFLFRF